MRATIAALSLGALLALAAAAPAPRADSARAREVAALRVHFDVVLAELAARDPSALDPAQRTRRLALLDTLRAYRDRGHFPQNHDFPGRAVPYFVDRRSGARCAVGHLLAATGRHDVVDRVAAADNHVRVPALAGDTAFTAWLDRSGLTLAEAARIQPAYQGEDPWAAEVEPARSTPLTAGTATALGASLALSLWNAHDNAGGASGAGNVLGLGAGLAALSLGSVALSSDRVSPALGAATLVTGAVSTWLGARGTRRAAAARRAGGGVRTAALDDAPAARPAPRLLPVVGGAGAGVALSLSF